MNKLLILLLKEPIPYKVKTRLINKGIISAEESAKIYEELLLNIANQLTVNKMNFYPCIHFDDITYFDNSIFSATPKLFHHRYKSVGDVIEYVIKDSFNKGVNKVVVSVTDAIYPTVDIFHHSFDLLEKSDVVLGKSDDGGFYLIGLNKDVNIFSDVEWSTCRVFGQMIKNIKQHNLSFSILDSISEIDTIDDMKKIYSEYKYNINFQHKYPFIWKKAVEINDRWSSIGQN